MFVLNSTCWVFVILGLVYFFISVAVGRFVMFVVDDFGIVDFGINIRAAWFRW